MENQTKLTTAQIDQLSINSIRFLSVDAVEKANSGHPGLPLDAAPMAYVLWTKYLRHNPSGPTWFDRDRFILSAGHGSMLLYSLLYLTGYDLPLEQIKHFRQWGSITPGHPERALTPGVEVSTGPLGQGFGNGVGMAIAEAHLAERYNRSGFEIINHRTFGIVSDGDLMEGVASESASLAGHLRLGKLIYLYDNNHVTLSASTQLAFTEDIGKRFDAYGWQVLIVKDGNDLDAIADAIQIACRETEKPSLIMVRTHLGFGSPKVDTFAAHGSPLGTEDTSATKRNLDWPAEPLFFVPEEILTRFRKAIDRGTDLENEWNTRFAAYENQYPELARELKQMISGEIPFGWDEEMPFFQPDQKGISTRAASGKVINSFAQKLPALIGGSADLNPSTLTEIKNAGNFSHPASAVGDLQGSSSGGFSYAGRNIQFGVREHAMGAITNGIAAHGGLIPFSATFFTFSDYMRPAIRLAALMELHTLFVFTHDSIALGEDGPSHQPIEHLAGLRAIPNLVVVRPADANETAEAWRFAVVSRSHPTALIFSRQNLPVIDSNKYAPATGLVRGGYILADDPEPQLILIATGSEVHLALEAREILMKNNIPLRVVSMPSVELFEIQPLQYRNEVLPPSITRRITIEAGATWGWSKYAGDHGITIGIDRFGASAPGPVLLREFGFTSENIVNKALELMKG
ncbi:MAG: transketolase [Syntrophothermus sp.]